MSEPLHKVVRCNLVCSTLLLIFCCVGRTIEWTIMYSEPVRWNLVFPNLFLIFRCLCWSDPGFPDCRTIIWSPVKPGQDTTWKDLVNKIKIDGFEKYLDNKIRMEKNSKIETTLCGIVDTTTPSPHLQTNLLVSNIVQIPRRQCCLSFDQT